MGKHSDWWKSVVGPLRNAMGFGPPTPEEAEEEMDEAVPDEAVPDEAVPEALTKEQLERIEAIFAKPRPAPGSPAPLGRPPGPPNPPRPAERREIA